MHTPPHAGMHTHTPSLDPGQDNHCFKSSFGWRPYKEILKNVTWGEECTAQVMWPVWGNEWISLIKAVYACDACYSRFDTFHLDYCVIHQHFIYNTVLFFILSSLYLINFPWLMPFQNSMVGMTHACITTHAYTTPCVAHSHSHRNSWAWLLALAKTVNGRSRQVATIHFSLIPIFRALSLSLKHTISLFLYSSQLLCLWINPSLIYLPRIETIIGLQNEACVHICQFHSTGLSQSCSSWVSLKSLKCGLCMCVRAWVREEEGLWNTLWSRIELEELLVNFKLREYKKGDYTKCPVTAVTSFYVR